MAMPADIKIIDLDIQESESEFKRDFPDTCPLCGDLK